MKYSKMITTLFIATLFACTPSNVEDSIKQAHQTNERKLLSSSKRNILFYNVENLFDTSDDPDKSDEEFTPEGYKKWTEKRYDAKLISLAKVIHASGDNNPVIIGLAEIENKAVIEDLIQTNDLKSNKYKVVHDESPDNRGIDVGLIYDEERFNYISHQSFRVNFPWDASIKTRDLLMVKGCFSKNDTVHLFVAHWPSRRGGKEASEKKRMQAAKVMRSAIDSIQKVNPNAKILCMGDFNDHPSDNSLTKGLNAQAAKEFDKKGKNSDSKALINLMSSFESKGLGSHNYKGEWGMLDQIVVSPSLFHNKDGLTIANKEAHILKEEWMLYKGQSPSKTYGGPNYYGGYSDHLPVFIQLK